MRIVNHRLVDTDFRGANSCGGRMHAATVVVVHDTASGLKPFSSVQWFENPHCTVSAHVVVERDGTVTQMVPFDTVAYHAGASAWRGRKGVNAFGIGIEIVNPGMMVRRGAEALLIYKTRGESGDTVEKVVARFPISECVEVNTKEHGRGWCLPYTPDQIETVTELCKALAYTYHSIQEVVTHWMISPGRKVDTTPLFPLEQVRAEVFGAGETAATADKERTPVPVGESPAPPARAGLFDGLSFSKINDLADEGSRIAGAVQKFKRWVWGAGIAGGTAAASVDSSKGTGAALKALMAEHPLLVLGAACVLSGLVMWAGLKVIEKYLVTAAKDGRYTPRGGQQ